jgi:membrane associated rhomboid family serine protease
MKLGYLAFVPVSLALATVLIVIYILLCTNTIQTDCRHRFLSELKGTFYHGSILHLLGNILVLAVLSRLEYDYGSVAFLVLALFLVLTVSTGEWFVRFHEKSKCSIGMSAVLLGLLVFELLKQHNLTWMLVVGVAFIVLYPTVINPQASIVGHTIGAVGGVIAFALISDKVLHNMAKFKYGDRSASPLVGREYLAKAKSTAAYSLR